MSTPQPDNPYAPVAGGPLSVPPPGYGPPPGYPHPGYSQPRLPYPPAAFAVPGRPLPTLASWGTRVAASLIDAAPSIALQIVAMVYAFDTMVPIWSDDLGNPLMGFSREGWLALIFSSVLAWPFQIWNRCFRQGRTGRSLGKSAMHIRLISEQTGGPVGAGSSFLRELCHYADAWSSIGYLWPLWDAKRQTFADKIMTTVVVED